MMFSRFARGIERCLCFAWLGRWTWLFFVLLECLKDKPREAGECRLSFTHANDEGRGERRISIVFSTNGWSALDAHRGKAALVRRCEKAMLFSPIPFHALADNMNGLLPDDNFLVLARPRPGQEQELPQCTLPPFDPSKPLPDYTRSWGDQLRRPTKLPDHYDTRIDPNHIFLFAVHPVTGIERDFYVTPKPCEYCARIRQVCSRSRPSCQRCTISGDPDRVCHVEDGWVKLPGPKCEKPKLQKRPMVRLGGKTVGTRGSSPSGTVPAPKRTRTIAPHPIDESLSSLSSTPTLSNSNHYEPMSIPKKPLPKRAVPITLSENGKAVSPAQSISAKALVGNAKKKGPPPKIDRRKGKKAGKKSTVNESSKEPEGTLDQDLPAVGLPIMLIRREVDS